jgi:pimeloyl-ACP methyl ester carboxylesterase
MSRIASLRALRAGKRLLAMVVLSLATLPLGAAPEGEHVVLVHGLWRSSRSMVPMEEALEEAGFVVLNVDYPSRTATIEELSEETIGPAFEKCLADGATKVHFVTHSLGGILVRSYFSRYSAENVGRVVMLGPPNQGSEAIDAFDEFPLFDGIMGPAARELGTDDDSVPIILGKPDFAVGIIAGNRSLNPVESVLIPGSDDSKVSVERTMLDGMTDHIVVPTTHPFMMRNGRAIRETISFLNDGRFTHAVVEQKRRPSRRR